MINNLKNRTVHATLWSGVERFSAQGISFLLGIMMARLLCPAEFGLIAMLSIFLDISQTFVDSGFANALIHKKDRTEVDFSTVFYFNVFISVIVYCALFFFAKDIAFFYNEPMLCPIMKCIGINIIISAFTVVQKTKFIIDLNFKAQAKISVISIFVSGIIGVILAYNGAGVWSLVCQSLINNFLLMTLFWISSKWRPLCTYSWSSFHQLFSFGSKLLVSSLLHSVYMNLYSLIIGRFYTATNVGYYNRMSSMGQFPANNIMQVIIKVIYPIQCQIRDDKELLNKSFIQYLRMASFIVFPIMIVICALAKPIVLLVLTEKWMPAVYLLQILCLGYMWTPIMLVNNNILNVMGRTDYFLRAEIFKKIIAFLILVITLFHGIVILCYGIVLYHLFDVLIIIFFSRKVIEFGYLRQLKNLLPILIISIFVGVVAYALTFIISNIFLQVLLGVCISGIMYLSLAYLFKFREIQYIRYVVKHVI